MAKPNNVGMIMVLRITQDPSRRLKRLTRRRRRMSALLATVTAIFSGPWKIQAAGRRAGWAGA